MVQLTVAFDQILVDVHGTAVAAFDRIIQTVNTVRLALNTKLAALGGQFEVRLRARVGRLVGAIVVGEAQNLFGFR